MKVGLVGLGVIGSRVGARLASSNSLDSVYNRTRSKAETFGRAHGVKVAEDLHELVSSCDVVFTVLSNDDAILSLFEELSKNQMNGKTFLDISTIAPSTSILVSTQLGEYGASMMDCPLVGSANMLEKGEATLLVGGKKRDFDAFSPLLRRITDEVLYVGQNGAGLRLKLVHNLVLGSYVVALSEAVHFGLAGGLDQAQIEKLLVSLSSIRSPNSAIKVPKILKADYSTQFSLKNMIKDLGIIEAEARLQDSAVPLGALALQMYRLTERRGFSEEDFSVVAELFKRMGPEPPK
ncbi:MAG: NAD(P)-dependent oxidoreductase [Thaumarchaeota archaeon]|nr:NAD(P)-dependent oxidoreductase [Nitrososphaerota archaeon]